MLQENPLYNLSALRNLVSNVKPAKKRDGIVIIGNIHYLSKMETHIIYILTSGTYNKIRPVVSGWIGHSQMCKMFFGLVQGYPIV